MQNYTKNKINDKGSNIISHYRKVSVDLRGSG